MLNSQLKKCTDCEGIHEAIERIDSYLALYSKESSNNSKYAIGNVIPICKIDKLIKYKEILLKRKYNSSYLWKIPNSDLISRINTLLN